MHTFISYCTSKYFSITIRVGLLLMSLALISLPLSSQINSITMPKPGVALNTVVKPENIDTAAYAEWVDGSERKLIYKEPNPKAQFPEWVLWTDKTETGYKGITYGLSKNNGPRHLRFGFHTAISVGSILAQGGGRPSVLKTGAAYPGNLNDESVWIPAQRMVDGQPSDKEIDRNEYALWVFPPGTNTRAIRFSHYPKTLDNSYEETFFGALVTKERYDNAAASSAIVSESSNQNASLLINGKEDGWLAWCNRDEGELPNTDVPLITKESPEWVLLKWNHPVKLSGLVALWAGFSCAEAQTYIGTSNELSSAKEEQWQTIASYNNFVSDYGLLWPNVLNFNRQITTIAIKLKITAVTNAANHLKLKAQGGKRIWLGELMALENIGAKPLEGTKSVTATNGSTASIAIPFTLKEAGYITLVIEDSTGKRVRNLISDTWFEAGNNTAYWDGLDDLERDVEAAHHGVYNIPAKFVLPGTYKVRGLVHGKINTNYEFSVYTTGNPPWTTDNHTGGWIANHTAPQSALFVPAKQSPTGQPAVYLGSYLAEGTDGLAWVDLDGKKLGGKNSVGTFWTAAPFMARDAGTSADTTVFAYVASSWQAEKKTDKQLLRITGLTNGFDKTILIDSFQLTANNTDMTRELGGIAVNNGIGVVSFLKKNQLMIIDLKGGKVLGTVNISSPSGLAFDAKGRLLIISSNNVLYCNNIYPTNNPQFKTVISSGLEAPIGIALDAAGNLFISDAGNSNQVKVFSADGKFIRAIGKPGIPLAGPYDSLQMIRPSGITIDSKNQLWVAENDFLPKRVSVWSLDGKLLKAFYGPAKYGGGGTIDGYDKTKFYYAEESKGTMEFELDWKSGKSRLKQILYRKTPESLDLAFRNAAPETPLYYKGKRYFTNCYNSNPTDGHPTSFLFVERNGIAYPAVAMGNAYFWDIFKQDKFKSMLPDGVNLNEYKYQSMAFFIWVDLNNDAQVQPEEITFRKGVAGEVTVMDDLSFCLVLDGKAVQFAPIGFSAQGMPIYKFENKKALVEGVQPTASSGGQILAAPNGWTIATQGILPFHRYSLSGAKDGKPMWSYPDLWPGLHAAHEAPLPNFSGELIGTTRLVGGLFEMKGSDAGPLWAVNSNHGMVYLFTSDGLFVTTLFKPMRSGIQWKMLTAERGMDLKELTLGEENFWPTITQTADGNVYMLDGGHSSIIKVDGLNNIQRLPASTIKVTNADLEKSRAYQIEVESKRQKNIGLGVLEVCLSSNPITVDGKFDDWSKTKWVDIDKSGVKANFNSNSKPYNVTGAVSVASNRLYIGYKTGDAQLLNNSGEMPTAPFKTGGALDVMIGADASSNLDRKIPVAGDVRLLVTLVKGKPKALLYRAVVAETKDMDKVPFSSPWRTISFDKVEDITSQVEFAASKDGNYEISIPLSEINLHPKAGMVIKGDIGVLRGDGKQTISRVYWNNKATSIVSDVPSEAELTPSLWGKWKFLEAK